MKNEELIGSSFPDRRTKDLKTSWPATMLKRDLQPDDDRDRRRISSSIEHQTSLAALSVRYQARGSSVRAKANRSSASGREHEAIDEVTCVKSGALRKHLRRLPLSNDLHNPSP